ncbi:hypothetical protein [Paracidovorax cattleyae]|uniref:hypothetical protein n=1 Tax=Paracidovorax cattleyae TaxID=80868 RepID=UPI0018AF76A7|nr:hypothetical protein [Paracidovorax cattleyae]MBF9267416.1 hypothetical protein [Paracidovorax cattleyae]
MTRRPAVPRAASAARQAVPPFAALLAALLLAGCGSLSVGRLPRHRPTAAVA